MWKNEIVIWNFDLFGNLEKRKEKSQKINAFYRLKLGILSYEIKLWVIWWAGNVGEEGGGGGGVSDSVAIKKKWKNLETEINAGKGI